MVDFDWCRVSACWLAHSMHCVRLSTESSGPLTDWCPDVLLDNLNGDDTVREVHSYERPTGELVSCFQDGLEYVVVIDGDEVTREGIPRRFVRRGPESVAAYCRGQASYRELADLDRYAETIRENSR